MQLTQNKANSDKANSELVNWLCLLELKLVFNSWSEQWKDSLVGEMSDSLALSLLQVDKPGQMLLNLWSLTQDKLKKRWWGGLKMKTDWLGFFWPFCHYCFCSWTYIYLAWVLQMIVWPCLGTLISQPPIISIENPGLSSHGFVYITSALAHKSLVSCKICWQVLQGALTLNLNFPFILLLEDSWNKLARWFLDLSTVWST